MSSSALNARDVILLGVSSWEIWVGQKEALPKLPSGPGDSFPTHIKGRPMKFIPVGERRGWETPHHHSQGLWEHGAGLWHRPPVFQQVPLRNYP